MSGQPYYRATVALKRASRSRWLARRRRGITATDAPALLGMSPWATPLAVWLDKVDPQPWDGNYSTRRGSALQRFLAEEYAATVGGRVEVPPMLLAHRDHPRLLCSLDYLVHSERETVVVECKTSSSWRDWQDDDMPDHVAAQALMQAAITGLPVVVVVDVNGRMETRRIERQPDWDAETIPTLLGWWDRHIVGGQLPPLDPYRDYRLLSRVWLPDPSESVEATDAVMGAVEAYAELREKSKTFDSLQDGLRTQIRAHMGTAASLQVPGGGQTVARVNRKGVLTVSWKPPAEGITAA